MNAQFKRGIVELCVLSELVMEDMYGYKIINKISKDIDVNENTIYPILRRLTKEGYFTTYLVESNQGAPRKYYKVTEKDHATKYAGFGFDASTWEIFPYLIRGACLHLITERIKYDIYLLNQYFNKNSISITFLPTQICEKFTAETEN